MSSILTHHEARTGARCRTTSRDQPGPGKVPRRNGFSILEVLIALVILSVGLLGLAALQAEGLRGSSSALQRTGAVTFAADIADRMRANRAGLADYASTYTQTFATAASNKCTNSGARASEVAAEVCTPTEMAEHDLFRWKANMAQGAYQGQVQAVAGATNQYTISVTWFDRTLAAASQQTYSSLVQF